MKVAITNYTKNPISAIEQAARNCYGTKSNKLGNIMKKCYNSGHLSVFEFAEFTFHIEDVSRALLAQLTRHRIASFAVRSQRYCDEQDASFTIPDSIIENEEARKIYLACLNIIQNAYKGLLEQNIPKEDARYILPNACSTCIELKMNFREVMHFFNERLCSKAQWEIRMLANEMKLAMKNTNDKQVIQLLDYCVPKCQVKVPNICYEEKCCGISTPVNSFIQKNGE